MATTTVRGVLKGALVLCVLAGFWNGACSTGDPGGIEQPPPPPPPVPPPPPPPPPPPAPSIVLTPASVAFDDTTGKAARAPQSVAISRSDTTSVALTGLTLGNITYVGPTGWLTATLSSTDAPANLTLTENKTGLSAGNYSATIRITSSVAANSPQSVTVTLKLVTPPPPPPPPPPAGSTVTIIATANLGRCGGELGQESAKVVAEANPDYIFVMGGNAIPADGILTTLQDYMNCYDPVWGQFKSKTYATLGDHEVDIDSIPPDYGSGMAPGADAYFGDRVGPPGKNWYSFDLGAWHIIGLNVQTPGGYKRPDQIAYHAGTDQLNWLIRDLRDHPKKCTLAVWYESMWISSTHLPASGRTKDGYRVQDVRGVWTALYEGNADLVINGWPRIYERFAPMRYAEGYQNPTPSEYAADPARGIRQITAGLGGDGPIHADSALIRHPLSEYRSGGNGVLKLVLGDSSYTWQFLNTKYSHIEDSGTGVCH